MWSVFEPARSPLAARPRCAPTGSGRGFAGPAAGEAECHRRPGPWDLRVYAPAGDQARRVRRCNVPPRSTAGDADAERRPAMVGEGRVHRGRWMRVSKSDPKVGGRRRHPGCCGESARCEQAGAEGIAIAAAARQRGGARRARSRGGKRRRRRDRRRPRSSANAGRVSPPPPRCRRGLGRRGGNGSSRVHAEGDGDSADTGRSSADVVGRGMRSMAQIIEVGG